MSLNYTRALTAIRARLLADATIAANIGMIGGDDDVPCIFNLEAPSSADSSKPTLVITRVSQASTGALSEDHANLLFDVHLFYGREYAPFESGSDCSEIIDRVRIQLNRWQLTATGMVASRIWLTNEIDTHDDESWHWVSTFSVHLTES